ncbi:putative Amidohydrolase-related domain-containing protein [Seiridium unicorne]|uniref:Amidohydrolase-related domain-containing protein n=1 Tax=Seiridium unicorne TaxID=138068 RepID=A0ABR2VFG7_9PEZI
MPESQTVNIPEGAWDAHIHVFEPERFAYGLPRSYTPKGAALKEYPFSFIRTTNILGVQATVQGHGPEPLLAVLDDNAKPVPYTGVRGLTTLDPTTSSDAELDALHAAGVRLHEVKWGHGDDSEVGAIAGKIKASADRIARLGCVVDAFTDIHTWAALDHLIRNELDPRVKLVADHFGKVTPGDEKLNECQVFLKLIKDGYIYVKLSGFERLYHGHETGIDSLESSAKAIIEAGSERILYGSGKSNFQYFASQ